MYNVARRRILIWNSGINVSTSEHDLGHYLSVAAAKLIVVEPGRRAVVERTLAHHHMTVPPAPIIEIDNQSPLAVSSSTPKG